MNMAPNPVWSQEVIFPIIAEIIRINYREQLILHDVIVKALDKHIDAQPEIERVLRYNPNKRRQTVVSNMIAWFGARITAKKTEYQNEFMHCTVGNQKAYGLISRKYTDNKVREPQMQILQLEFDEEETEEHISYPDEEDNITFTEGTTIKVTVNRYERSPQARRLCIGHYGYNCCVCDFNFEEFYGSEGKNFIHIHHLRPLSEIGKAYILDAIADLRPVCPNCHAIIHKRNPVYSIEEARLLLIKS